MDVLKNTSDISQEEIDKFYERYKKLAEDSENYKKFAENNPGEPEKLGEDSDKLGDKIDDDFNTIKQGISQATISLRSACQTIRDLHNIGDESISDENLVGIRNKVTEHAITYKNKVYPDARDFVVEIMDYMESYKDLDEKKFTENIDDFKEEAEYNKKRATEVMSLHTDILTKFKVQENGLIKFVRGLAGENNVAVSIHKHVAKLAASIDGFVKAFGKIAEFFSKLNVNLELASMQIRKAQLSAKNKGKAFFTRFSNKSQEIYKSCDDYITSSVTWKTDIEAIGIEAIDEKS